MSKDLPSSGTVLFFHVNNNPAAFQEAIRLATAAMQRSGGATAIVAAPQPKLLRSSPKSTDVDDVASQPSAQHDIFEQIETAETIAEPKQKRTSKREEPKMIEDLDASAIAEWAKTLKLDTNVDRALASASYLKEKHQIAEVRPDHIYTCFKFADWAHPKSYVDLLNDTRRKSKFFATGSKRGTYKVVPLGENRMREMKAA